MTWRKVKLGDLLVESRIPALNPDANRRIRVRLNVLGVEKRPLEGEKEGGTKQFIRKSGQFIYGKQNLHKGAFGVVPSELDGFETSADIPCFDVRKDCLPEWIYYYFKVGNRYLELAKLARGVGSKRIHPEQLTQIEIPLPDSSEQEILISEFRKVETRSSQLCSELTHQLDLVKQLRQAFLREAMQGKLVPQDPKDEPASELLRRIKAEKVQLIKEGKLKKALPAEARRRQEKELPPIKPEEIPFEIPEGWVWCRFGILGDCRLGKMLDIGKNKGRLVKYLRNTNIQWQVIEMEDIKHIKVSDKEFEELRLIDGDLLICEGGVPGRCAIFTGHKEYYTFQKALHRFRSGGAVLTRIVELYLKFSFDEHILQSYYTGNQIKHLTGQSLEKVVFPLPPLSEQHRIVAKQEQLMRYCDELEQSIKQSQTQNEQLLQQVLREALRPKLG